MHTEERALRAEQIIFILVTATSLMQEIRASTALLQRSDGSSADVAAVSRRLFDWNACHRRTRGREPGSRGGGAAALGQGAERKDPDPARDRLGRDHECAEEDEGAAGVDHGSL